MPEGRVIVPTKVVDTFDNITETVHGVIDRSAMPVVLGIDSDALDMALVPGCVSAEPEEMSDEDLRQSSFALAERADIVGLETRAERRAATDGRDGRG